MRSHYAPLDGLRGFAALSVVLYHLGQWFGVKSLAANSFFAVDLFFCLSGYVMPLAYGHAKKPGLKFREFFSLRVIRLMTLTLLAALIGGFYVFARGLQFHEHIFASLSLAMILGILCLPYFNAPHLIGGPEVFPLNGPQYTLFFELFINFVWFAFRKQIGPLLSILLSLVAVIFVAIYGCGGDTTATFWEGFARVTASFFLGICLFDLDRKFDLSRLRPLFWPASGLMLVIFFLPLTLPDAFVVIWLPISALLVLGGTQMKLGSGLNRLCLLGGEISYPVYVLQYPLFCWTNGIFQKLLHKDAAIEIPIIFCAIIIGSYVIYRIYDLPVRGFLTTRQRPGRGFRPADAG